MGIVLDGKIVAEKTLNKIREKVEEMKNKPSLHIISAGEDPASKVYVRFKLKRAESVGIKAVHHKFKEETEEKEILSLIERLNRDKEVDGFIVQLPLPKHINKSRIINAIAPDKDVDGFHPLNMGKIFLGEYDERSMIPATPYGIMKIIEHYSIETEGKNAVVVGRSNIVGKPIALLLLKKNATITLCHSRTKNLKEYTKRADILISAVGKRNTITADMVKEGASVIDVGINRYKGKLCGDVDFKEIIKKANCTPVPGGVGPNTVAMLLWNTLIAAENHRKGKQ